MAKLEERIGALRLFARGGRILVAVSGGVDSMVLLHILHRLGRENGWQLAVAHLNHQLRGRSSGADERLVRRTAKAMGLRAIVGRANVRAEAKKHGLSIEMAARKARQGFLARTARKLGIRTIALAHHADDQVELFLLRLLRGSGAQGLSGMARRNRSPVDARIELVRPFLEIPKEALRRYARANKVAFREDATNNSLDILRNRVRHELIPLLKRRYQPALDRVLARTSEVLRAESEWVDEEAAKVIEGMEDAGGQIRERAAGLGGTASGSKRNAGRESRGTRRRGRVRNTGFDQWPRALQRRVLQMQLLERGIVPDFDLIEALRTRAGERICASQVRKGEVRTVFRDAAGRIHTVAGNSGEFRAGSLVLDVSARGCGAKFDGLEVQCKLSSKRGTGLPKFAPGREVFDADLVGTPVILRHWRAGDRFQPIGMGTAVKIQDFLTNQKIPREKRHELVLATTVQGEVFWIEGMRISERFKLTRGTIRRLHWGWERL